MKWCFVLLCACVTQRPISRCQLAPNQQPFTSSVAADLMAKIRALPQPTFPASFQWGTATAPFQVESNIAQSDWSQWVKSQGRILNGDLPSGGPEQEIYLDRDLAAMATLGTNSYRFGIELSQLFASKEAVLSDSPNAEALAYYNHLVDALVASGQRPMLTLQHFSLPVWLDVLSPDFVPVLEHYAAWAARTFGDRVDYWITLNEPSGLATAGFINGSFPPGRLVDFSGFAGAYAAMAEAHARMYDAIVGNDRNDADGDDVSALVSFATHNRLWLPADPANTNDVRGARRVRYISNLVLLEAAACGNYDADFDEVLGSNDRVDDARLKDRLDFIALNYYGTAGVVGFDLEPFRGLPQLEFPTSGRPKNDVDWDLAPEGLLGVLAEVSSYRLPIIITENGLADAADTRRPKFLVDSILALQEAAAEGYDIRGYYHWSLMDNFEWALGFCPKFGLFSLDADKHRVARPSASVYRQIIEAGGVPHALRNEFSYGAPSSCFK